MVYTVCKKKIIAHGLQVGAPPGKNLKLRLCLRCLWCESHLSAAPSLSSTFRPFSSYSALESQKPSLSFMMLASTAPPMNTMCLRRGGSSMRSLNFCAREREKVRENSEENVEISLIEAQLITANTSVRFCILRCLQQLSLSCFATAVVM